jgi:hypothetical protein
MAHPCFNCGGECYCSGSIDDVIVDLTPMSCTSCDWCQEQEEERHWSEDDEDDEWYDQFEK